MLGSKQASTILTALCSASTLLIVSLGLFGLCQKLFVFVLEGFKEAICSLHILKERVGGY